MARTINCNSSQTDIYASLPFCPGTDNMPGIRVKVFFIRRAHIQQWPSIANGAYSGNFTLASGKYFKFIEIVVDKSKFTAESQGAYPCKTFRQHLEMNHPVLDEAFAEFQNTANNDDLIYIVQQSNGKYKVLGCENYPTDTKFSDDSGSVATDAYGSTITAECDAPTSLLIYSGSIMIGESEDANESDD